MGRSLLATSSESLESAASRREVHKVDICCWALPAVTLGGTARQGTGLHHSKEPVLSPGHMGPEGI